MKIAVQNPSCLFESQERNFNGYNFEFIRQYCDIIFVTGIRTSIRYRKKLKELGWKKKVCLSVRSLNRQADVLVCFNGRSYLPFCRPPKGYRGLKIYHTMDYSDNIRASSQALQEEGVQYLMGYCRHDRYSPFFQRFFSAYRDRVIPVPFGYGARFVNRVPFENRINKCIALGSVNPVNDPLMESSSLADYVAFYSEYEYSHPIRKAIVDHLEQWSDCFDSRLPVFPETKNNAYNAVEELNRYTMFINDESIDNFPPARTYEGIACGCVMVCTDSPIYADLGFRDGVNCIMFRKGDYSDMIQKIRHYMQAPSELEEIQRQSLILAESYSHSLVAKRLYSEIEKLWKNQR